MTENRTDNVAPLRFTAFGRVLCGMLKERGLPVTPFHVGKLAEDAGLDGWKVINRMASADAEDFGDLRGLDEVLGLDPEEKRRLTMAFAIEEER